MSPAMGAAKALWLVVLLTWGLPTIVCGLMTRSVGVRSFVAPQLSHRSLHRARIHMSTRGGTVTKMDTRTAQKTATKPTYKEEIDKNWRLVLHDDTVHTIQHVCDVIERHVPLCPGARAYEVTLEVHMTGQATVCVSNKKLVEEYTKKLQSEGLTVSMAPDDDFEGEDEVDDEGDE